MNLNAEQFQQSFGTYKILMSLVFSITNLWVFTPLYKGVKETLWNCQHIKKSRLKLWSITNDLLPDMVVVLWRINFKSIPIVKEHRCRQSCIQELFSCLIARTLQSSGGSDCTLRTIVLCQRFLKMMTCCHYVIFRTYCDILIEFSCNLYCSGVQKA